MLTAEDLEDLAPGDSIEMLPLFPGLSDEPLRLKIDHTHEASFVCTGTYFGVWVGQWMLTPDGTGVKWRKAAG